MYISPGKRIILLVLGLVLMGFSFYVDLEYITTYGTSLLLVNLDFLKTIPFLAQFADSKVLIGSVQQLPIAIGGAAMFGASVMSRPEADERDVILEKEIHTCAPIEEEVETCNARFKEANMCFDLLTKEWYPICPNEKCYARQDISLLPKSFLPKSIRTSDIEQQREQRSEEWSVADTGTPTLQLEEPEEEVFRINRPVQSLEDSPDEKVTVVDLPIVSRQETELVHGVWYQCHKSRKYNLSKPMNHKHPCPGCQTRIIYGEAEMNPDNRTVKIKFICPKTFGGCGHQFDEEGIIVSA